MRVRLALICKRFLLPALLAGIMGSVLTDCATAPPPPPPRMEVRPPRPGAKAAWVPGHWEWRGRNRGYVWVVGHWRR